LTTSPITQKHPKNCFVAFEFEFAFSTSFCVNKTQSERMTRGRKNLIFLVCLSHLQCHLSLLLSFINYLCICVSTYLSSKISSYLFILFIRTFHYFSISISLMSFLIGTCLSSFFLFSPFMFFLAPWPFEQSKCRLVRLKTRQIKTKIKNLECNQVLKIF